MTADTVRYFFLDDFTGRCVSTGFQEAYDKREGCDVLISARGSANPADHVYAHSQVLMFWSRRFNEIIRQAQVKRVISPEDPLISTISSTDFPTIRLLIDMIYYGSACVPGAAVPEFLKQGAKMRLKLHEETAVVTPDTKQNKRQRRRGNPPALRAPSCDSAYASMPSRNRVYFGKRRGIGGRDLRQGQQRKRKQDDRMSHEEEERPCKRICKKSEMENQIQLSPGSRPADQGCDLLDLSIVPTIDSD